jgi:microcystin-dependent protein
MKKMKLNIQLFSIPHTYIEFEDYPSTNTPLNATNLNQMQNAIHDEIKSFTPVGVISSYAGPIAPTGWLICNGAAISRTEYATLFEVIGTTYGSGDGETTFNLPNLKGRVPVGLDSNDTDFDTSGNTGGEKTHTLNVDEIPGHNHMGRMYSHNYDGGQTIPQGRAFANSFNLSGSVNGSWGYSSSGDVTNSEIVNTIESDYTGGNGTHNNLQPYIVLNYIIKY